jgi:hypothetical protein
MEAVYFISKSKGVVDLKRLITTDLTHNFYYTGYILLYSDNNKIIMRCSNRLRIDRPGFTLSINKSNNIGLQLI